VVAGSWETALESAGAGLAAVSSDFEVSFVMTRPPGHHARREGGMGFCLFNNIAVAAAALVDRGERVAIVDWDVHHGNGTQEIFWDEPSVVYVSTHQAPFYPGTGRVDETGGPSAPGTNVNIPLPAGATGDVVLRALSTVGLPVISGRDPGWVLVSAGFDAHRDDPLASLCLSAGDFFDLAALVRPIAPRCVLFLEGGYDLEALRMSVGAAVSCVGGGSYRPEGATNGGPGRAQVEAAVEVWRHWS
jgi:acetoin utilization deacetylase AcuC-like enzyme